MSNLAFKKAEKMQAKLRLAITGPSGSGKTHSALLIASGMGKRIALIDTENHRAALKADEPGIPEFDTAVIEPPYTIDKYIEAMKAAIVAGYDVLILDSASHAWVGEGGLLEKKGALDIRGGNSYTNWAPITKEHEQFKAMLLNIDVHLIVTMRSKQDYVVEINDKGKSVPRKIGLAPEQRNGMEYEFSFVFDLAMDHNASVSKTDFSKFDKRIFTPSKQTGEELISWLNSGSKVEAIKAPVKLEVAQHTPPIQNANPPQPTEPVKEAALFNKDGQRLITSKQRGRLFAILKSSGKSESDLKDFLKQALNTESTKDIPMDDYEQVCAWLEDGPVGAL